MINNFIIDDMSPNTGGEFMKLNIIKRDSSDEYQTKKKTQAHNRSLSTGTTGEQRASNRR
jgi:hypothetical protein